METDRGPDGGPGAELDGAKGVGPDRGQIGRRIVGP